MWAAEKGHKKTVSLLLDMGADKSLKNSVRACHVKRFWIVLNFKLSTHIKAFRVYGVLTDSNAWDMAYAC
jgi:hypothetical protein